VSDPFPHSIEECATWKPPVVEPPKWFDWEHWGLGIGSDRRYKPRWRERRAYVMGLRDAAREAEKYTHIITPTQRYVRRDGVIPVIKGIHAYVRDFLGLPADSRRFGFDGDDE
jgi:hypothetical protein